jgi:hypothetical protein
MSTEKKRKHHDMSTSETVEDYATAAPSAAKQPKLHETNSQFEHTTLEVTSTDSQDQITSVPTEFPPELQSFAAKLNPQQKQDLMKLLVTDSSPPRLPSTPTPAPWKLVGLTFDERPEFTTPWIPRRTLPVPVLWKRVKETLSLFSNQSQTGRDYCGFVISGASGTGKTRSGYEFSKLLRKHIDMEGWKSVQLYSLIERKSVPSPQPFPTSSLEQHHHDRPLPNVEKEKAAEDWLKDTLGRGYGVSNASTLPWNQILDNLRIAEQLKESENLLIFLHMDEFQHDRAFCTHFSRVLGRLLTGNISPSSIISRSGSHFHASRVLVLPIFTGTWTGALALATEFTTWQFMLSGLDTLEDARGFFDNQYALLTTAQKATAHVTPKRDDDKASPATSEDPKTDSSFTDLIDHDIILGHLGYIPRMIQAYCRLIAAQKNDFEFNFDEIWRSISNTILQLYDVDSASLLEMEHLCVLAYFKIPVALNYRLNGRTVLDMMESGYLFLSPIDISGTPSYHVVIPYIFCAHWLPRIFDKQQFSNPRDQVDEYTLPKFCMLLHQTTYSMLALWIEVQNELKIEYKANITPSLDALMSTMSRTLPPLNHLLVSA